MHAEKPGSNAPMGVLISSPMCLQCVKLWDVSQAVWQHSPATSVAIIAPLTFIPAVCCAARQCMEPRPNRSVRAAAESWAADSRAAGMPPLYVLQMHLVQMNLCLARASKLRAACKVSGLVD